MGDTSVAFAGPPPAPASPRHQRRRLVSFFKAYAPGRLEQVDGTLAEHRGREDALFAGLVKRYGPEPPMEADPDATATAAASDNHNGPDNRRVRVLSTPAEPTNPNEEPDVTHAPGGGVVALRPSLSSASRYGGDGAARRGNNNSASAGGGARDESAASPYADLEWSQANLAALLIAFYGHVDPAVVARAPREAQHYYGREYDLFDRLQRIYGTSPVDLLRARAAAAEVSKHRESTVHHTIRGADGAEGDTDGAAVRVDLGGDRATKRRIALLEARLRAFYEDVAPDKITNARQLAAMFGGADATEEQLLRRLEQQYGKRPPELSEAHRNMALAALPPTPSVRAIEDRKGGAGASTGQAAEASRVEVISDENSSRAPSSYRDPTSSVPSLSVPAVDLEESPGDAARRPNKRRESSEGAGKDAPTAGETDRCDHDHTQPPPARRGAKEEAAGLPEAVVIDLFDDAIGEKGQAFADATAAIADRLWPRHVMLRSAIAIADLDDEEDRARRAIDVEEYSAFAQIKSQRRRLESTQRLLNTACASASGVPTALGADGEVVAKPARGAYSAFDSSRPGVRCYRAILEQDDEL
eukprot:CAMPEP_0174835374 /NCGR_PEP_ID=MMETSP1114-20130205/5373_1 /TAXON_ID=312471 /ORGANISM="Neobodo designis, Strain CCAP 1951/1" /LENGTH=586 /DNA_ID=CAMNT_0016069321 /DNA_START=96 /DNA_END=1856 /DNA_ORIENTATION=-